MKSKLFAPEIDKVNSKMEYGFCSVFIIIY